MQYTQSQLDWNNIGDDGGGVGGGVGGSRSEITTVVDTVRSIFTK